MATMRVYLDESEEYIYRALQQAYAEYQEPIGASTVQTYAQKFGRNPPSIGRWSVVDFADRVKRTLDRLVKKGRAEAIVKTKTFSKYDRGTKAVSAQGSMYYKRAPGPPVGTFEQTITKYIPIR